MCVHACVRARVCARQRECATMTSGADGDEKMCAWADGRPLEASWRQRRFVFGVCGDLSVISEVA